jgi:hypothetical protein
MAADGSHIAETRILRPSYGIWISLAVVAGAMTWFGFDMLGKGDRAGWISLAIGAPCLAGTLPSLIPGSAHLKLTREGFVRRIYWLNRAYRWEAVEPIVARTLAGQRAVVWNLREPARRPLRTHVFRAFFGVDYALADGHGMELEELAALMNEWRERAVGARLPS